MKRAPASPAPEGAALVLPLVLVQVPAVRAHRPKRRRHALPRGTVAVVVLAAPVGENEPGLAHAHERVIGEGELVLVWVEEADEGLELPPREVAVAGVGGAELEDGGPVGVAASGAGLGGAEDVGDGEDLVDPEGDDRVGSRDPVGELAAAGEVAA